MNARDPLRRLVPANAAQRLGTEERIVILSLRDVLRGLAPAGGVLLVAVCEAPQMLGPVLRALRHTDAVLGVAPGADLEGPRSRHAFFASVCEAAEAVGCNRPMVLSAPPVVIGADVDAAADRVFNLVDAGFTHVPLDVSGLEVDEAPAAILRAGEAVVARELGLEVLVAPGQEDDAGEIAAGLKLLGSVPDAVGVRGGGGVGLAVAASEVEPVRVSWWEGADPEDFRGGLRNAIGSGARLVALRSPLTAELLAGAPGADVEELRSAPLDARRAERLGELASALEGGALDRMEMRVAAAVEELVALLQLRGATARLREQLTVSDW